MQPDIRHVYTEDVDPALRAALDSYAILLHDISNGGTEDYVECLSTSIRRTSIGKS